MQLLFPDLQIHKKAKTGHLYNKKSNIRTEYSILEELEHSTTVSREAESKFYLFSFVFLLLFALNGLRQIQVESR